MCLNHPQVVARVAHVCSYPEPITFSQGDLVTVTDRSESWQGYTWVWSIAADGRAGWIPPLSVAHGIALRDFSAQELTVAEGELLEMLSGELGWCWCVNCHGDAGWVPQEKLSLPTA